MQSCVQNITTVCY